MTLSDALKVEWDAARSFLVTFCQVFGVLMAFDTLSVRRLTFGPSTTPFQARCGAEHGDVHGRRRDAGRGVLQPPLRGPPLPGGAHGHRRRQRGRRLGLRSSNASLHKVRR